MEHPRGTFQFGRFKLELSDRRLTSDGEEIYLRPKTYDTLLYLVERPGHLVTKKDLLDAVWEAVEVSENALTRCIKEVRAALGDEVENPHFIRTVPRLGYEFIANVDLLVGHEGRDRGVDQPESPQLVGNEGDSGLRFGRLSADRNPAATQSPQAPSRLRLPGNLRRATIWLAAAVFVVVAASIGLNLGGLRGRLATAVGAGHGAPFPKIESIAVLPLENLSGDSQQEYFADGMTEELITDLGKISALRVISRQSIMRYKGSKKPLPEIARELNVDAIVEGTVRHSGDRVRVSANLLYAPTDRHLWAETYERNLGDVLTLQDEVARTIASQIKVKLTPQENARLARGSPVNPEAYRLYLQGRYYYSKRTLPALNKSVRLFQQALEKDPISALTYAALSESYGVLPFYGGALPREAFPKARAAALKALELDNSLAEAHAALGPVLFYSDRDWLAAERELKRAIELNPNYVVVHLWYADYLSAMGRHEQAIAEIKRAQELDPVSPLMLAMGAGIYNSARRYDEGIGECRKALELDPNLGVAHGNLGWAYCGKGMYKEAVAEYEEEARLIGSDPTMDVANAYILAGRRGEALKMLSGLREQYRRGEIFPLALCCHYTILGEKQRALGWLQKAYEDRDPYMVGIKNNLCLDPLRSDPRFQDILRRMNFPP